MVKEQKKQDKHLKQVEELKSDLQRVQAEFENFQKRMDKEREKLKSFAKQDLIKELLDVLDTFELALKDMNDEHAKGMQLIYNSVVKILKKEGVKPMECVGKKFDPKLHDALQKEDHSSDEDTIIEEFKKGYMFGDVILRHAKVKVSTGKNG